MKWKFYDIALLLRTKTSTFIAIQAYVLLHFFQSEQMNEMKLSSNSHERFFPIQSVHLTVFFLCLIAINNPISWHRNRLMHMWFVLIENCWFCHWFKIISFHLASCIIHIILILHILCFQHIALFLAPFFQWLFSTILRMSTQTNHIILECYFFPSSPFISHFARLPSTTL